MKSALSALAVLALIAGCAGQPPKTETTVAAAPVQPAPVPAAPVPKPVVRAVETPRIAADPLDDPNGPLAKRSIYYEFDKSGIGDQYKPLLQAHAGYLAAHRATHVRIEGNCDERGSREYNLALGQRRADSVKAGMKVLGVADEQIETVSWGEEKPRAAGHDEAAWSQNRRSDIVYDRGR
jgi:peptidoglycan-associated lipoprotein